ncbi:MAG: hypothetical protein J6K14_03460 [Clostridia bacterium]|nr:hypothetical protein [Clostridia bacterium]
MEDYGILIVRATTASGAYPVPGVSVSISGASDVGGDTRISVLTDVNGATQPVLLPAPPRALSLSPESTEEVYSRYDIEIFKEGYYRKKLFDVTMFSGITSVLPVNMIPSTPYNTEQNAPRGSESNVITENPDLN